MESVKQQLKLGILGMSAGNGHPYSWSAIFNGYQPKYMRECPFPVIPQYLAAQQFPEDAIQEARVTHIWTQEQAISEHISQASNIPHIVTHYEDMIGQVDGILLARDDPEYHYEMSAPFIRAGLPIFIDKPLAASMDEAKKMLELQVYEGQVFTCSSLVYAKEFQLAATDRQAIGDIQFLDATVPKDWKKYAIHIIDPALHLIGDQGEVAKVTNTGDGKINITTVKWTSGLHCVFKTLDAVACPLSIRIFGSKGFKELVFRDTFYAFKQSLLHFVKSIKSRTLPIPRTLTLKGIEIIEKGMIEI